MAVTAFHYEQQWGHDSTGWYARLWRTCGH